MTASTLFKSLVLSFAGFTCLFTAPVAQAANPWALVFQQYFQPVNTILKLANPVKEVKAEVKTSILSPTILEEEPIEVSGEESKIEVELKPSAPSFEASLFDRIRVFKKEEVNSEPLARYLDFVVPETLTDSLIGKMQRENTRSAIVTPQDMKGLHHRVTNAQLRSQGIKELIGAGVSTFYHSDYNRRHNVFNAISKFDGWIIPQGEEFSFNEKLQNAGPSNGFLMAKIISNGMTKWGWGGGVCQLSTTVFRAAYNSGLPITARRNHTFQVPYYGWEREEQGMDATIYLGSQDLKFVNDTPGDVMIQIVEKDDNLVVLFYGTRDREVIVEGPDIKGLSYKWYRTVARDGVLGEKEILASYYQPEIKPVVEDETTTDEEVAVAE